MTMTTPSLKKKNQFYVSYLYTRINFIYGKYRRASFVTDKIFYLKLYCSIFYIKFDGSFKMSFFFIVNRQVSRPTLGLLV